MEVMLYIYIPRHPWPSSLFVFVSLRVVLAALVSSQDKATPLHQAAAGGHTEVVKALLTAGANVHALEDVSVEEEEEEEEGGGS
jgi:ankyrin repeat protein